jgi:hypothetical protein
MNNCWSLETPILVQVSCYFYSVIMCFTYKWNKLDHFKFVSMVCVLDFLVPWRYHVMYQIEDMRGSKFATHTLQMVMCYCTINRISHFDCCPLPNTFLCFVCETWLSSHNLSFSNNMVAVNHPNDFRISEKLAKVSTLDWRNSATESDFPSHDKM